MGMEMLKKNLKIIFYRPNFQSTPKGGSLNGNSAKGKKAVQLRLWHLEQLEERRSASLSQGVSVINLWFFAAAGEWSSEVWEFQWPREGPILFTVKGRDIHVLQISDERKPSWHSIMEI